MIQVKRIYDKLEPDDGFRVLVDRLWPRGISKERAKISMWLQEIAPSNGLRQWFAHDPNKWPEFKRRYFAELKVNQNLVQLLIRKANEDKVTLLYGAKDTLYNNAMALNEFIKRHRIVE